MATKRILVTGGAGFVGSFLVDKLVEEGHTVRIFDLLDPQVHPDGPPPYLNREAEFIRGDIRDCDALEKALRDVEVVFHQAAVVGVGQSQYQIKRYVESNIGGTANLLDRVVNGKTRVEKLIVAASMSSYGEGKYGCTACGDARPDLRSESQMAGGDWEVRCPSCGSALHPKPTDESTPQTSNSIYGITKKTQEEMVLNIGRTYHLPAVALRYFNIFGPRQSLSNPYTGVAAIFMSRIKNDHPPVVYEDGKQTRDFISVHDIVQANLLAMQRPEADYHVFNVGRGEPVSIQQVAKTLARLYESDLQPHITRQFRKGDIRHCYADIGLIRDRLGFSPRISFEQGMRELVEWAESAEAHDHFDRAARELRQRSLI